MRPSLNLEEFLHLLYDKFYKLQQHTSETSKFSLSFFTITVIPLWTLKKKKEKKYSDTRARNHARYTSCTRTVGAYKRSATPGRSSGGSRDGGQHSTHLPPDTLQMKNEKKEGSSPLHRSHIICITLKEFDETYKIALVRGITIIINI